MERRIYYRRQVPRTTGPLTTDYNTTDHGQRGKSRNAESRKQKSEERGQRTEDGGRGGGSRKPKAEMAVVADFAFQSSPGMMRRMNSSNNGTVKAVSPWLGLQIMPLAINWS